MEKLKKLFPLSFKHCKSVKSLIWCAMLYIFIFLAADLAVALIISPLISTVLNTVLSPLYLIGYVIVFIAVILCCTIIGAVIGIPLFVIGAIVMHLPAIISVYAVAIIMKFASIYMIAGCVIAILAYAGVFGKTDATEEVVVEESAPAIEAAPEE